MNSDLRWPNDFVYNLWPACLIITIHIQDRQVTVNRPHQRKE